MKNGFFETVWGDKFGRVLSLGLCVLFVWSAIAPYGRGIWYVESATAVVAFVLFALFARNFKFSRAAYAIFCLWEAMQIVGAHYSFELVPFDFFTNAIGASRNHYDRLAHFAVGLNAFAVAEYLRGRGIVNSTKSAAVFGVVVIMALANLWELMEWAYAEIDGGEVGAAFLGSQGDVWDAQKDMLADTLGALAGASAFVAFGKPRRMLQPLSRIPRRIFERH